MPRGIKGSGPYAGRVRPPKPSRAKKAVAAAAAAVVVQATPPQPVVMPMGPLGSVDVDGLQGDALKHYARRAGVPQRDIDYLTEDRLRANVKITIANHFELLTEG